jgi:hypothetical protein
MSGQTSEVIHCPNCKEDVPKTLYCLNCGYPLYKLEQQKPVEQIEEPVLEQKPMEEVDMSVEIQQPELPSEVKPTDEEDIELEEISEPDSEIETRIFVDEEEEPSVEEPTPLETTIEVQEEEPVIEESITESVVEAEKIETQLEEVATPFEEEIEIEEVTEETVFEYQEEIGETIEPLEETVIEPEVETDIYTPRESEPYMMDEVQIEFAPDPLTKEVMENLAKNITLKIRLIRLLRESQVKEETFKKLFDSYVEQGRLWASRREEIIRRLKSDIERMEQELITARKDYELLEIRKSIGDASEEEYSVKAPAYKWDIGNLDKEIKNTRGGIQYVVNLRGLIPEEEIDELKAMAENDYSELDEIEGIRSETLAQMKETLSTSLKIIES